MCIRPNVPSYAQAKFEPIRQRHSGVLKATLLPSLMQPGASQLDDTDAFECSVVQIAGISAAKEIIDLAESFVTEYEDFDQQ